MYGAPPPSYFPPFIPQYSPSYFQNGQPPQITQIFQGEKPNIKKSEDYKNDLTTSEDVKSNANKNDTMIENKDLKDNTNKPIKTKLNKTDKVSVGILISAVIIIIIYVIWLYIAYKKNFYPFTPYTITPPKNTFYPTGNITPLTPDEAQAYHENIEAALT